MSEPARLIDEDARLSIASELDSTLFVEAGAGSGKTTALVGRIVALVGSGRADITAIAAITFTEAAAAELRIKVRQALEDGMHSSVASSEERARWADALGHIDEAPISTIHGFCNRVLAAHPIEAGLPPRFEVLDEISESIEWQRRWSAELDLLADEEAMGQLLSLAWTLGVYDRHIEGLASAVDIEWHRSRPDAPDLARVVAEIAQRASAGVSDLHRSVRLATEQQQRCSDPTDKLCERLAELSEWEERLSATADWQDAFALITAETRLFSRTIGGQKQFWDGDVETVRDLLEDARLARERLVQGVLDLVVGPLAHYFEARAHVAASDRRKRGVLNFHDLLVLTRDLLRDHPRVLESVRKRYTYLLIDEFQDTDRLQLEIARLIGVESGDWVRGRCFFVGDPKQSIYRFRGADLAAYESARAEIVADATTLLTSNFRSVPGIISFVNSCFEVLLGSRFQSLHAVRPVGGQVAERSGNGLPPVSVIGGEIPGKPLRREQRRIESEDCCRAIERAVVEESWLVEDGMTGGLRPARLGDVAILVPRRTGLVELEAALDQHDIGYRVESASLIFKSQEVRDVLHLARAIAEPGDEAALVGALRSPAYSIGDDELVRWAEAHGGWSIEEVPPPAAVEASPRIATALESIASFRERLVELGPVGTLSFAVRERRLLQLAADSPHSREAWRRIRYLIERARVFVEAGGGGLAEFADWIDDQVQGGLRSSEAVVPDADEDVVRIMTVHGAKGLEFPITVLCGFGTTDETFADYETTLRHQDGAIEVHFTRNLETSGYKDLKENERRLDAEEATRLLYVASTRARDYLIICAHHVKNGRQTLGERLAEIAAGLTDAWGRLPSSLDDGADVVPARFQVPLSAGLPEAAVPDAANHQIGSIDTLEAYEEWRSARARRIEEATKQASVRATEVASLAGIAHWGPLVPEEDSVLAAVDNEEAVLPTGGGRRRGRAGTRVGRAVHATLQSLLLSDAVQLAETEPGSEPPEVVGRLEAIAHAQARAERVGERGREVSRLVRAALTSPVVREAFTSGTARREVYVSAPSGGTVVDGYVDLCFTGRDGALTVIDYKTDSVRNQNEAAERAASYELQAAAYALALRAVTGRPVARCVLVFLAPPAQPIEHELAGELLAERIATVGEVVGVLS